MNFKFTGPPRLGLSALAALALLVAGDAARAVAQEPTQTAIVANSELVV